MSSTTTPSSTSTSARRCSRPRRSVVTADRSEARLLELAIQVVHLHPVDEDTPVAALARPAAHRPRPGRPDHRPPRRRGHPAGRRTRRRGAGRRPRHLLPVRLRPGRGRPRAALPPPPTVGAGPGRPAAGVEGPQGRRAHHPPSPEAAGVRRRPGRHRRRQQPAGAEPDRPGPPGAGPVRPRDRPPPEEADQAHRDVTFYYHGETSAPPP